MPVNTSAPSMVVLQQNAVMMGFGDVEQCAVIGQSLDSLSGLARGGLSQTRPETARAIREMSRGI